MDRVRADPEESFDRTLDTVIKNIRAAIRSALADTTLDPVETGRGMGYCLRGERFLIRKPVENLIHNANDFAPISLTVRIAFTADAAR